MNTRPTTRQSQDLIAGCRILRHRSSFLITRGGWISGPPFGTPPDLIGRYALGLDFAGQPVYEVLRDPNPNSLQLPANLLTDSPYELDLSGRQRRDIAGVSFASPAEAFDWSIEPPRTNNPANLQPGQNDDAPFATTDLERVLRAWDARRRHAAEPAVGRGRRRSTRSS